MCRRYYCFCLKTCISKVFSDSQTNSPILRWKKIYMSSRDFWTCWVGWIDQLPMKFRSTQVRVLPDALHVDNWLSAGKWPRIFIFLYRRHVLYLKIDHRSVQLFASGPCLFIYYVIFHRFPTPPPPPPGVFCIPLDAFELFFLFFCHVLLMDIARPHVFQGLYCSPVELRQDAFTHLHHYWPFVVHRLHCAEPMEHHLPPQCVSFTWVFLVAVVLPVYFEALYNVPLGSLTYFVCYQHVTSINS